MLWYVLKLIVLLPLIGLLAWGCLLLARRMQERAGLNAGTRSLRVVETMMLSPTQRLAVIAFHDREILVAATRHGLTRLAEAPARADFDALMAARTPEP
ncbi:MULTISPECIES: FliO/MopB family protein [Novosphingobium]|uniref:FliO/MopB family protein n=1 Tax=unclassified Novosphingobium TaxID=2644732 RepID=UPI0006C83B24|nr:MULTISPECIES: flagellar biosynthetic protein FliO [unclassified Novosphingobium]KPH64455.1 flagellar biogenesis protein [Novosphingobium sp. ST904]MPS68746.1 flagellar biogenesis protein [Novosphingobium sp.]TCM31087.1 flagellar protein FliO/FliZ [Novosphingobium sp. ST904]